MERGIQSHRIGPYTLQAAIAAVHAESRDARSTDWRQIVGLYDVLLRADPSPIIELNRAAAVAMSEGAAAGLALIDAILVRGDLADYHLAHAARADLCRRLGRVSEAIESYEKALSLTTQNAERSFIAEGTSDPLRVTVSIGLASSPEDARTRQELVHRADLAAYRAKAAGGNRCITAT